MTCRHEQIGLPMDESRVLAAHPLASAPARPRCRSGRGGRGVSIKGRVDGLVLKIKPEAIAIPPQAGSRDRVVSIDLQCDFVALVRSVVLPQALVEDTHQTLDFARFRIDVARLAKVPLGVLELIVIQGLPGKDQVGRISPGQCPSEQAVNDRIGTASG
jgi:hypothetical protein